MSHRHHRWHVEENGHANEAWRKSVDALHTHQTGALRPTLGLFDLLP